MHSSLLPTPNLANLSNASFCQRKLLCGYECGQTMPMERYVDEEVIRGLIRPLLTPAQIAAVEEQYSRILSGAPNLSVRHVYGWTFPDGEYFPAPYFVFSSGNEDFGVARISHGRFDSVWSGIKEAPFCIVELIQGIQGRDSSKLPLKASACRAMLTHILRSSAAIVRTGWTLALLKRKSNERLVDPYFRRNFISSESYYPTTFGHSIGSIFVHLLNPPHKNKAVREVLQFARRERAGSEYLRSKAAPRMLLNSFAP